MQPSGEIQQPQTMLAIKLFVHCYEQTVTLLNFLFHTPYSQDIFLIMKLKLSHISAIAQVNLTSRKFKTDR